MILNPEEKIYGSIKLKDLLDGIEKTLSNAESKLKAAKTLQNDSDSINATHLLIAALEEAVKARFLIVDVVVQPKNKRERKKKELFIKQAFTKHELKHQMIGIELFDTALYTMVSKDIDITQFEDKELFNYIIKSLKDSLNKARLGTLYVNLRNGIFISPSEFINEAKYFKNTRYFVKYVENYISFTRILFVNKKVFIFRLKKALLRNGNSKTLFQNKESTNGHLEYALKTALRYRKTSWLSRILGRIKNKYKFYIDIFKTSMSKDL